MKSNNKKYVNQKIKNKNIIIEILNYFPIKKKLDISKGSNYLQSLLNVNKNNYDFINPFKQAKYINHIIQKESNLKSKNKTKQIIKAIIDNCYLTEFQLNEQKIFIDSTGNFVNSILQLSNTLIIISNKENKLKIFDIKTRKIYKTLSGHKSAVFKILFPLSTKLFFISITFDGEIIQWDNLKFNIIQKRHYNNSGVIHIIALNESPIFHHSFGASYWDLSIELFTMEQKLLIIKDNIKYKQPFISFYDIYDNSQLNHFIYCSLRNNIISIFGLMKDNTYAELKTLNVSCFNDNNRYITNILPIPFFDKIFFGFSNGSILAMNYNCSKSFYQIQPHSSPVNCLLISNKKRLIISSAYKDKNICIFNCDDLRNKIVFNLKIGIDNGIIQLNDGKLLFSNEGIIKNLFIDLDNNIIKIEKELILFKEQ